MGTLYLVRHGQASFGADDYDQLSPLGHQQALRLGLEAQFIDAQTPADIPDAFFQAHAFSWERPIKITEVACFMSHHQVWQQIADSHEPALVLEDDAILAHNTPDLLKHLEMLNGLDHVSLETRQRQKLLGRRFQALSALNARLHPLLQDRTGAAAYVLWPSGARLLLTKFKLQGMGLADAFISSTYLLQSWQTNQTGLMAKLRQRRHDVLLQ